MEGNRQISNVKFDEVLHVYTLQPTPRIRQNIPSSPEFPGAPPHSVHAPNPSSRQPLNSFCCCFLFFVPIVLPSPERQLTGIIKYGDF